METTQRNATLADMAALLKDHHARKVDVVAPATKIRAEDGRLVITDTEAEITMDGVTQTDGVYLPTRNCDSQIAEKLGIHGTYVRKMRDQRIDLWDANVNGWLHGVPLPDDDQPGPDSRSFLVRCFRGDDGGQGVARAFLSDKYRMIDNLDVLTSALRGIEDTGIDVDIDSCDLTEDRMYVRVVAPEVQAVAETLLKDYRNPFGEDFARWQQVAAREGMGYGDGEEPVVFAGFVLSNSETGGGAFTITPRMVIKVCKNGLTINVDAIRNVHLGGKMDAGVVDWSADTMEKETQLVRAKTRDAVRTFLTPEYLVNAIARAEESAGQPISSTDEVKVITKRLSIPESEVDGILSRFIQGGQMTKGGVANAITAHAQLVEDGDRAASLEEKAGALLVG